MATVLIGCGLSVALATCEMAATATPAPSASASALASPSGSTAAEVDPVSGLPVVHVADLPVDAFGAIKQIRAGGPFTDPADGAVYSNSAGILPAEGAAYYRQYRVTVTGGTSAPATIVAGGGGEMYWSVDGGRTFVRVVP